MRTAALFCVSVTVGCGSNLAAVSSGHVGCHPTRIAISDEAENSGARTWTATCSGRRFFCTQTLGGNYGPPPQVNCAEDRGPPPVADAAPQPWTVREANFRFTLPGTFRADVLEGRKIFHPDQHWGTALYFDVEAYAGSAADYANERFPDRSIKRVDPQNEAALIATKNGLLLGRTMRIATLITTHEGAAYALTCADSELESMSATCKAAFRSFRLGAE